MDSQIVFLKTDRGLSEIQTRQNQLPNHVRLALILVDGQSDVETLQKKAAGLSDLQASLERLAIDGFIRTGSASWKQAGELKPDDSVSGERARVVAIRAKIVDIVILVLGERDAERVLKPLNELPGSLSELRLAIDQCRKLVSLTIDEKKAAELHEKCDELLSELNDQEPATIDKGDLPELIKGELIDLVTGVLGKHSHRVIEILHDAAPTLDGLNYAIERCRKLIELTIDEKKSHEISRRSRVLLGRLSISAESNWRDSS